MTPNKRDLNITERKVSLEHRHFAFIAAVLKDSKPEAHWDANKRAQWQVTVHRFIARCKSTNPKFNADRFLAACGFDD